MDGAELIVTALATAAASAERGVAVPGMERLQRILYARVDGADLPPPGETRVRVLYRLYGDRLTQSGCDRDPEVLRAARKVLSTTDPEGSRAGQYRMGSFEPARSEPSLSSARTVNEGQNRRHGSASGYQRARPRGSRPANPPEPAKALGEQRPPGQINVDTNMGIVAGDISGPITFRTGNALGAVMLAAGLLPLVAIAAIVVVGGHNIGWKILPVADFTIKPTWWTSVVPLLLLVPGLFTIGAQPASARVVLANVWAFAALWPALFGLLVWQSGTRLHGTHWWSSLTNVINSLLQDAFRRDITRFTSVYLCLFMVGLLVGLINAGVRIVKNE